MTTPDGTPLSENTVPFVSAPQYYLMPRRHTVLLVESEGTAISNVQNIAISHAAQTAVELAMTVSNEERIAYVREARAARKLLPEKQLIIRFEELLAQHQFASVAVPMVGKTIRDLEAFRFIPIVSRDNVVSLYRPGPTLPDDPMIVTREEDGPYLDTRQAVGLVHGQNLIAIGCAGIDRESRLLIKQTQDTTGIRRPERGGDWTAYNSTGLQSGFWWRDTLARAWEEIALDLGVKTAVIESGRNSYLNAVKQHGGAMDAAADRLGYSQMEDYNWIKTLHR